MQDICKRKNCSSYCSFPGAQNRNRTSDTGIFSPLLYLLSYLGIQSEILKWWAIRDLNPGHAGYEPDALTN